MNTESTTPEGVAVRYVQEQLALARKRLQRTRIIAIVFALFVLAYLSFVTHLLRREYLNPKPAAAMINLQLGALINDNAPALTAELKQQIPALIAQIPDRVIEHLPALRTALEDRLEEVLRAFCLSTGDQLASHLDDFLKENKDSIEAFVEASQHPEGVKALGDHLEEQLADYLKFKTADGKSIQEKLGSVHEELKQIETRLRRLATATDLTPDEKKLRHAIAVTMHASAREAAETTPVKTE